MTKIKVLELIKGLDTGGAEVLLTERLAISDRQTFDYRVGYLTSRRLLLPVLQTHGIDAFHLASEGAPRSNWLIRLRRYLVSEDIDVVHVHSPLMAVGVRAVVRSLGGRRPALVATEHSIYYHPLTGIANEATVRADDVVIAVSAAVARGRAARRARSVRTIHHGVNLRSMRELRTRRADLSATLGVSGRPILVSVANFRPEKGHSHLIKAFRAIRERFPDAQLYLAGQGPLSHAIQAEVQRLDLSGHVHNLGHVPHAARLSACADVFILSSMREGRPIALTEALACGVPAVATAVGGVPDLITDGRNGFLVPPGDGAALAGAVSALLADPQLSERFSAAAQQESEAYDLKLAVDEIEDIYRELARKRAAGAL